jgi:eukaryotic-like serine/threonine-protein kinase
MSAIGKPAAASRYLDPGLTVEAVQEPCATLADGAAGVAYFLLRHARFGGGERSLEAARCWSERAVSARKRKGAFASESEAFDSIPPTSVLYREPGVWWVRALVASAAGDAQVAEHAGGRFAQAAVRACGKPGDVGWGSAGLLLGCAQLVEAFPEASAVAAVRAAGEQLALELATFTDREGARPGEAALGCLGAAHGWAGVVQALLRWSVATAQPVAGEVPIMLERLMALRRPSGCWPITAGSREVWRGWCHGSAGWAMLWALAWQATGEKDFLTLAEVSARDATADADELAILCCGRAGQAFAALTLFRITREQHWLAAASRVATDAVRVAAAADVPVHSLFNGELGVALLVAELEDPERSAMPLFEALRPG